MKNEMLSLPGYRICEYSLVLQPHEELRNKIMHVKKEFAEKFDLPSVAFGKPQLTIAKFQQIQMMEDRICNRLTMVAMAMPAFKVELKDFGSFPSHTIYLNVDAKSAVTLLVKHLKTTQRLLKTTEHRPQFMESSHITIASKLLPEQFGKAWLEYSHKHFTGRFIANNMLLLRRCEGMKTYQPLKSFEFLNIPVVTKQGELF